MKVIVDRFEGKYCICEKDIAEMIKIEMSKLPDGLKEGDVLVVEGDRVDLDTEEAEKRKSKMYDSTDDMWK